MLRNAGDAGFRLLHMSSSRSCAAVSQEAGREAGRARIFYTASRAPALSQDEANADDESRPISGICRSRFAGPKGEVIGQREIGQMKAWQRDLVGVGTPLTLSAATLAFAPEHAVPEWMILVASAGAIIAIAYAWWRIYVWMDRRQNYYLVSGMMLLVALIGSAAGLMFDFIWLKLLSGLVPIAIGVFVSGFARRLSRRLASAQSPRSGDGS